MCIGQWPGDDDPGVIEVYGTSDSPSAEVRPAEAAFADVVCADEDWLRAEFDAIIAANFATNFAVVPNEPRHDPRPGHDRRDWPGRATSPPATVRRGHRFLIPQRIGTRERAPPAWPREPIGSERVSTRR